MPDKIIVQPEHGTNIVPGGGPHQPGGTPPVNFDSKSVINCSTQVPDKVIVQPEHGTNGLPGGPHQPGETVSAPRKTRRYLNNTFRSQISNARSDPWSTSDYSALSETQQGRSLWKWTASNQHDLSGI